MSRFAIRRRKQNIQISIHRGQLVRLYLTAPNGGTACAWSMQTNYAS
jgi:hypothetical protein